MKFIDLFAGLGGFNLALSKLGHECVFACEIDETLRALYQQNFGIIPAGDIRSINANEIPRHEILCAGFPCQPFSKAGGQEGFNYPVLGNLYLEILKIIQYHHPRFIILENVPNFQRHGNGKTWDKLKTVLELEKYNVEIRKLSPHNFGIPQIRERVYIVGSLSNLNGFKWPVPLSQHHEIDLKQILDNNPPDAQPISPQVVECINIWQEFLDHIPADQKIPHPLWSNEFGATYPFENLTPYSLDASELSNYLGDFGRRLPITSDKEEILRCLPSYARRNQLVFPDWKIKYIRKNREFYILNATWLDEWKQKIIKFPPSFQKLEWNCQDEQIRQLNRYILQIRPSGLRVKRPTTAPSLVAMTATQVPIVAWEQRYMTTSECKRLQSMDELCYLPKSRTKAYEALGNAINVEVVQRVAAALIGSVNFEEK